MDINHLLRERAIEREKYFREKYEKLASQAVNPVSYEEWCHSEEGTPIERYPVNPFLRLTRKERRQLAREARKSSKVRS